MSEQEKMLTIKQASSLIEGVSQYRIRKMCVSGELPTFKSGKKYLIHEKTLRHLHKPKQTHAKKVMPARMVISELHKEIEKSEDDSISLKAIHSTEKGVEFTGRRIGDAYRSHKRKPYKRLEKAQHKSIKADVNYLYQKK